jgi:aspartyl-tRNA(Asn)/glutamyl-tRNA(Gln) amidotransferase subunit A
MGVIAGPDPLDPTTVSAPAWNAKRTRASPKGLRIGVPARFYVDDLESDIASALDATIVMLRKLGAMPVRSTRARFHAGPVNGSW